MSTIHIHRCHLRLVRHDGWSWGPEPRALLQAALRALPALLAAALAGLWPEEDEREIVAPVRLRVRLRASELLAAQAGFSAEGPPPAGSPAAEIVRQLAASLTAALGHELPQERESGGEPAPGLLGASEEPYPIAAVPSLGRLLRAWSERGALAPRLALLSEASLAAWVEALLRESAEPGGALGTSSAEPAAARQRATELRGRRHRSDRSDRSDPMAPRLSGHPPARLEGSAPRLPLGTTNRAQALRAW